MLTRTVPYCVVVFTIALSLAFPGVVQKYQAWPFLASMVVIGLPHGAGDHLVPVWAKARRLSAAYLVAFFVGYLAIAALVWGLWVVSPLLGAIYFLAITVWHWGSADASDALPDIIGRPEWIARSLSRGAIIIAGPVAVHFAAASVVIASLAEAFHSRLPRLAGLQETAAWIAALGIAVEFLLVAGRREMRLLVETVLLVALVAAAPPLAAIGVYFLGWHSLRHLARLTSLRSGTGSWQWPELGATYLRLVPLTMAALALLTGMGVELRVRLDQRSVLAVYLILISALTLPHAAVTGWLDWREQKDGTCGVKE